MNKRELVIFRKADLLASAICDEKTYEHAKAVAEYVTSGSLRFLAMQMGLDLWVLKQVAFLHDALEDTDYKPGQQDTMPNVVWDSVKVLTKHKDESYEEYLIKIKRSLEQDKHTYAYPYLVKLADMKDHLNRKETLTDKLKEKYLNGLAILL